MQPFITAWQPEVSNLGCGGGGGRIGERGNGPWGELLGLGGVAEPVGC